MTIYPRIDILLEKIKKYKKSYDYHERIKSWAYNYWWNEIDYWVGKSKRYKRKYTKK